MTSYCFCKENHKRTHTHTHILSTVHRTSICLTPDTLHSDLASCPTRASPPLETFHQSFLFSEKMGKVPHSNLCSHTQIKGGQSKEDTGGFSLIFTCRHKQLMQYVVLKKNKSSSIQTQTAKTAAIQCNYLNY